MLIVMSFRIAGLRMARSQTNEIVFLRKRGIVEKDLWPLFITLNCSYFFNKTDFEQYLVSDAISSLIRYCKKRNTRQIPSNVILNCNSIVI